MRPLLKEEAKKIPEYFPVARPAIITTMYAELEGDAKAAVADSTQAQGPITPNAGSGK